MSFHNVPDVPLPIKISGSIVVKKYYFWSYGL